jgi:hypothetical protein
MVDAGCWMVLVSVGGGPLSRDSFIPCFTEGTWNGISIAFWILDNTITGLPSCLIEKRVCCDIFNLRAAKK